MRFKRLAAGITVLTILSGATACGTSEGQRSEVPAPTGTTAQTTTGEKIKSGEKELTAATTGEQTEAPETTTSDTSSPTGEAISNAPDCIYVGDTEAEVRDAVNKALTAYSKGDIEGIVRYSDMEIPYYLYAGETGTEEQMIELLNESEEGTIVNAIEEGVEWEVLNVAPVNESTYSDMYSFLTDGKLEEIMAAFGYMTTQTGFAEDEEDGSIVPSYLTFKASKELFNITDIYAVRISANYDESTNDIAVSNASESSGCFYVFRMNGQWKLDVVYSSAFAMYQAFSTINENRDR